MFVIIAGLMFGNVLWSPMMQELVPPELLGRASSVDWLMSLSLSPLGVIVGGAAAGVIGTRIDDVDRRRACRLSPVRHSLRPGVRDPERHLSSRAVAASR